MTISRVEFGLPEFLSDQARLVRLMKSEVGRVSDRDKMVEQKLLDGDLRALGAAMCFVSINDGSRANEAHDAINKIRTGIAADLVVVNFAQNEAETVEDGVKTITLKPDRDNRFLVRQLIRETATGHTPRVVIVDAKDKRLDDYGFSYSWLEPGTWGKDDSRFRVILICSGEEYRWLRKGNYLDAGSPLWAGQLMPAVLFNEEVSFDQSRADKLVNGLITATQSALSSPQHIGVMQAPRTWGKSTLFEALYSSGGYEIIEENSPIGILQFYETGIRFPTVRDFYKSVSEDRVLADIQKMKQGKIVYVDEYGHMLTSYPRIGEALLEAAKAGRINLVLTAPVDIKLQGEAAALREKWLSGIKPVIVGE